MLQSGYALHSVCILGVRIFLRKTILCEAPFLLSDLKHFPGGRRTCITFPLYADFLGYNIHALRIISLYVSNVRIIDFPIWSCHSYYFRDLGRIYFFSTHLEVHKDSPIPFTFLQPPTNLLIYIFSLQ